MMQYQRVVDGVVTNQWTSDFAGADYTENGWGSATANAASFTGSQGGTSVTVTANNTGYAGNVQITVDGTETLSAAINAWNTANPSNTVSLTSGDGTQVFTAPITLSGGTSVDYTIVATDITAQVTRAAAVQVALTNQSKGAIIIANVSALNESKLQAGTMTQQTFTALLADQNLLNIERLLWNGSLVTAKALTQAANLSAYYTTDEVNSIIALFP